MATSDAAFRGGACPTPEYTIAYTGNYTTSADASQNLPITLSKHRQIGVCHDCRQIVTGAMSARPGTDQDSLRIAELATLVGESQPHARHSVDKDAIMAAIDANAAWILAVKDFWVHREEAIAIRFEQWRLMRNGGVSPQAARRVLVPGLVAAGTLPSDDPESWFDWMIMEGERLSAGDEQEGI